MVDDKKILQKLNSFIENNEPIAMVTIVDTDGSTPRGIGSTMLVDKSGNLLDGTIGGGALEEEAKKDAVKQIVTGKSRLIEYKLDNSKNSNALPMTCGGNVSIFVKVYKPQERLIIAGAGHVSEKVAKLANFLGYQVIVMDDRKERLNHEIFPESVELVHGDIVQNLQKAEIANDTMVIIVTHGHEYDQEALKVVLRSEAKYIGMIGSISKIKTCFRNLLSKGYTEEELLKVYTPIGINIGGETPEEIALSIMVEIQAIKYNADVPHLSQNINKF